MKVYISFMVFVLHKHYSYYTKISFDNDLMRFSYEKYSLKKRVDYNNPFNPVFLHYKSLFTAFNHHWYYLIHQSKKKA